MSTTPTTTTGSSNHRHAVSPLEKQRSQLERLLKDPSKPAFIPPPPKEKTVRPAREMMKNVQGSSAGAGSGEFHVYKASRRREYERIKLMEEEAQKEAITSEFERKRRDAEEQANAKTAKNRARRQKKKEKAKTKGNNGSREGSAVKQSEADNNDRADAPIKKRRLVSGRELVFRKPGEESEGSEEEGDEEGTVGPELPQNPDPAEAANFAGQYAEASKVVIHEDD